MKAWAEQFNNLKPITKAQKEYHRLRSAKYIFVKDKSGVAVCSRCGKEINVGHTKHKSEHVCPHCKNKMIIQHEWRMSQRLEIINWMVIPKVINNKVLCLRYILAYQRGNKPMEITEEARMFIDEDHVDPEYYCRQGNSWNKGKDPYFRRDTTLTPNRFWCIYADEYPKNFFKEINKLDCFKYYSAENEYNFKVIPSQLSYMVHAAKINEKLAKIGMKDIAEEHRYYYCNHNDRIIPYNKKETSLKKMIGLDQNRFNLLREFPSMKFMFWLQNNPDVNYQQMREAKGNIYNYLYTRKTLYKIGVSYNKLINYLEDKEYGEYDHYLTTLKALGYDIKDTYYSMPKDFRAADERITKEYEEKQKKSAEEKRKINDGLIKKISDGIRNMPNLKEFLDGSNGLLIYVPESSADLEKAGKEMHCCLGTYPTRVAEGKTMVFFVRKLDNPTAQFVAFEYCDGQVLQCRYTHNETVKDTQIIDFVNRFTSALKAA